MNEEEFEELMRFQRTLASKIVRESEVDNKIKILTLLTDMLSGKKKRIPVESILVEAGLEGMSESEVLRTLSKLKEDNIISEPEQGFIRMD
ncbi:MAG: hypothetical protein V1659_00525 [Candidatus Woesearchaeota archaeon]